MTPTKADWALSFFWINLSIAIVVLILIATDQISSVRNLVHVLVYGLVYVSIVVLAALGCLLAQTLLMEIGVVVPQHFWPEYLHTLRVAMPLAVVFGVGALVHGSLRGRVQFMEAKVHEKEVAEERTQKLAAEARLRSL